MVDTVTAFETKNVVAATQSEITTVETDVVTVAVSTDTEATTVSTDEISTAVSTVLETVTNAATPGAVQARQAYGKFPQDGDHTDHADSAVPVLAS